MAGAARTLVFTLAAIALALGTASGDDAHVRIVLFTPSDVEPPPDIPRRMKEIVDYGQAFYGKWLRHWGYEPVNVIPVDRNDDGTPVVYFVKGTQTAASGKYDQVGFQNEVREQAITQFAIPRQGSTWWIFVYGTKLKASRGWGGHADRNGNGITLLVWNDIQGGISADDPLAAGAADRMNLKGYLHEFGHTMSLPHIGPNDRHRLGMSLMGPNARTYRRARSTQEGRVYITPATAGLIWKQPQMTGRFEAQPRLPRISVSNFRAVYERRSQRIVLTGRLRSDLEAHSIVAIDIPETGPGDYWKKGYAVRLKEDGSFELPIDELLPSSGVLKVVFCFDNGVFTGNGEGVGFRHAAEIPYRYSQGNYRIGQ